MLLMCENSEDYRRVKKAKELILQKGTKLVNTDKIWNYIEHFPGFTKKTECLKEETPVLWCTRLENIAARNMIFSRRFTALTIDDHYTLYFIRSYFNNFVYFIMKRIRKTLCLQKNKFLTIRYQESKIETNDACA